MEHTQFKVGDWGFCEFKLMYIKKMSGDNITSVSDGHIEMGSPSLNDRFFPIDVQIKRISDYVAYWHNRFHKECKGINFPNISRKLVVMWVDTVLVKDNEEQLKAAYDKIDQFGKTVIEKTRELKFVEVDGVNIFG